MEKQEILKELLKQRELLNNTINRLLEDEENLKLKTDLGSFHNTVENIISKACFVLGYSYEDFTNKSIRSTKEFSKARKMVWHYLKTKTSYTSGMIAKPFNMDSSSIRIGATRMGEQIKLYKDIREEYQKFENILINNLF